MANDKVPCKYGASCYQKNKYHLEKYTHPQTQKEHDDIPIEEMTPLKKIKIDTYFKQESTSSKKEVNVPGGLNKVKEELAGSDNSPSQTLLKSKVRDTNSKLIQLETDKRALIKQLFSVEMPEDFYSFWEMCESLNKADPINALKDIKLKLVGPFDILANKVTEVYEEDIPDFLRHWRFYYDPPEFQTVLVKEGNSSFHYGYYRDEPTKRPVMVASNELNKKNPEKNGELIVVGDNLFAALKNYLDGLKTDPFSLMKIPKYHKLLNTWVEGKEFSLRKECSKKRNVVAKTFHGAGIVVPVDKKKDVGYRELAASNAMIKKILNGIVNSKTEEERKPYWDQLYPIVTYANIANDEYDFGTSLELGLDLFTFGSPLLHKCVRQLLTTAYNLLGRTHFSNIIQAHLENRIQGSNLSIL